ncbi:MAG: phospholipid-binding protein [bacterium]|nr:phospholipid-binding protein [bacterium]
MPIITISRQLGSTGTEIAKYLREDLKCNLLDKESLEDAFEEYGVSKQNIEKFDERKPGFWELFKTDKTRYLHFLKGALYKFAGRKSCIIVGRAGQILLQDAPGVLHVRVVAPMETRVERVMEGFQCDGAQAEKLILHSDHERAGFHKFFFDENWEDPNLYHLVLNTAAFSVGTAAELISSVVKTKGFKAAQKETEAAVADLILGHQIKTKILYDENVSVQFLEIVVAKGIATIRGIAVENEDVERCETITAGFGGVREIKNEVFFKPLTNSYGIHY